MTSGGSKPWAKGIRTVFSLLTQQVFLPSPIFVFYPKSDEEGGGGGGGGGGGPGDLDPPLVKRCCRITFCFQLSFNLSTLAIKTEKHSFLEAKIPRHPAA